MAIILSFWWANSQRESIRTNLARIELSSLLSHLLAYNPSKNVINRSYFPELFVKAGYRGGNDADLGLASTVNRVAGRS
jgi:hypothetical protein